MAPGKVSFPEVNEVVRFRWNTAIRTFEKKSTQPSLKIRVLSARNAKWPLRTSIGR